MPGGHSAAYGRGMPLSAVPRVRHDPRCHTRDMSRSPYLVALGVLLVLAGTLWTLQGLGIIGRGSGSGPGATVWAVLGPFVALGGIILVRWPGRRP